MMWLVVLDLAQRHVPGLPELHYTVTPPHSKALSPLLLHVPHPLDPSTTIGLSCATHAHTQMRKTLPHGKGLQESVRQAASTTEPVPYLPAAVQASVLSRGCSHSTWSAPQGVPLLAAAALQLQAHGHRAWRKQGVGMVILRTEGAYASVCGWEHVCNYCWHRAGIKSPHSALFKAAPGTYPLKSTLGGMAQGGAMAWPGMTCSDEAGILCSQRAMHAGPVASGHGKDADIWCGHPSPWQSLLQSRRK